MGPLGAQLGLPTEGRMPRLMGSQAQVKPSGTSIQGGEGAPVVAEEGKLSGSKGKASPEMKTKAMDLKVV